jgi:hypothetical protein
MNTISIDVVSIERRRETFTISALPQEWDEMSDMERYGYISGEGTLVSQAPLFFDIDHVEDVSGSDEDA